MPVVLEGEIAAQVVSVGRSCDGLNFVGHKQVRQGPAVPGDNLVGKVRQHVPLHLVARDFCAAVVSRRGEGDLQACLVVWNDRHACGCGSLGLGTLERRRWGPGDGGVAVRVEGKDANVVISSLGETANHVRAARGDAVA